MLRVFSVRVGGIESRSGSCRVETVCCCDRALNGGFLAVQSTDCHSIHNFCLRVMGPLDPEDENAMIYRSNGNSLAMSWNIQILLLFKIIQCCY